MSFAVLPTPLDRARAPLGRTVPPPAPRPLRGERAVRGVRPRIDAELTAVVADGIARARRHAAAAERSLASDPVRAGGELRETIACAREALDEMRALVGVLRSEPAVRQGRLARTASRPRLAAADRARLARELHDVVGASFAVISVQAGAARVLAHVDPAAARTAVGHVLAAADRALAEVGGLASGTTIADAVARARPTRLWIDLEQHGDAAVCARVEHAAARIVQEALTNAHEHGAVADPRVRVRVERSSAALRLTVVNAVAPPRATTAAAPRGGGFGVAGMHERARAVGGTCAAGRLAGGAWLVRATLPARAA